MTDGITDYRSNTIGTYCGDQTGKRVLAPVIASVALLTFHLDSRIQYRRFERIFSFFFRAVSFVWCPLYEKYVFYSAAWRSVLGKTVPEVLVT